MSDDIGKDYIKSVKIDPPGFEKIDDSYRPLTTYTQGHTVERYVRVNVTKNTKGYNTDVTVSVTTTGNREAIERELSSLLVLADDVAQEEIRRQQIEALESYEDRGT